MHYEIKMTMELRYINVQAYLHIPYEYAPKCILIHTYPHTLGKLILHNSQSISLKKCSLTGPLWGGAYRMDCFYICACVSAPLHMDGQVCCSGSVNACKQRQLHHLSTFPHLHSSSQSAGAQRLQHQRQPLGAAAKQIPACKSLSDITA